MSADRDPAVDAWDAALNDARARLNAADPIPAPRTALDRWEDQGWTGPDDEQPTHGEAEAATAAERMMPGGGGAW